MNKFYGYHTKVNIGTKENAKHYLNEIEKFLNEHEFFLTCHILSPVLGLDWSEESGEELEDSEQASPYQVAWSIRETLRYERHT